jgi:hypothetical protein
MTYPAVDDLPEAAASALLGVFAQLSQSRHPGLARWAFTVSNALLCRLVSVTTGVNVGGTGKEDRRPLATLTAAELDGLHALLLAGAEASDDESVARWCSRMDGLVIADFYRRELEEAALGAKVDAIIAGERRPAGETRSEPATRQSPDLAAG